MLSSRIRGSTLALLATVWLLPGAASAQGKPLPEVIPMGYGEVRVVFDADDCVVFYDQKGDRRRSLPKCKPHHLRDADGALKAYRRENALDAPDGPPPKHVKLNDKGAGNVLFKNGCQVIYDKSGNRKSASPECGPNQKARADHYMLEERRKQGLPGFGGPAPKNVKLNNDGSGAVGFKDGCVVKYDRHGNRRNATEQCGRNQKGRADEAMADARRAKGLPY